jgi:hypothetical protein
MVMSRLICRVSVGRIRAELRHRGALRWAAEAEWTTVETLAEVVAELAGRAELPAWGREVRFVLENNLIQARRLHDLPPLRRGQVAALVALTPQRYFRRNGTPLVTDACWVGPRGGREVVAVAVELPLARALVRGAAEAGLAVAGLGPDLPGGLSLLPPDEQARRDATRRRWTRWSGMAAAVAWVVLGATIWAHQLFERRRLDARLEEVRGPLAAVLTAEAGVDSAERMIALLERESGAEGEVVAVLFRVAAALPDSAFLTQLRVDSAGVGLVAGAARRPAAVLAALEGRAGLTSPRFEGRTSRDVVAGQPVERFAIGFGARAGHP